MSIVGILAHICIVFWSLYLIYGLISTARGQGDITWWVWPPIIFAYLPLLFRGMLGETAVDWIIVCLNAVVLLIAVAAYLVDRFSERRSVKTEAPDAGLDAEIESEADTEPDEASESDEETESDDDTEPEKRETESADDTESDDEEEA